MKKDFQRLATVAIMICAVICCRRGDTTKVEEARLANEKKETCNRCQRMKEIVDGAFKAKRRENVEEKCKQIERFV